MSIMPFCFKLSLNQTTLHDVPFGNRAQDITLTDFQEKVEKAMSDTNQCFTWVHFEGRNIDNAVQQINWLHTKATKENWRDRLTISAELEKPDRENIDALLDKGDILFFSKLFAEKRGFSDAPAFLKDYSARCRPR
jgi:ketohexokinase